jgi:hypothetical protein
MIQMMRVVRMAMVVFRLSLIPCQELPRWAGGKLFLWLALFVGAETPQSFLLEVWGVKMGVIAVGAVL